MTADDHLTAGAQWPNTPSGSDDDQPRHAGDVNDWLRRKTAGRQRRSDAHERRLGITDEPTTPLTYRLPYEQPIANRSTRAVEIEARLAGTTTED